MIVLSLQALLRASDYATFAVYASSCLVFTMLALLLPIETKGRSMKVRIILLPLVCLQGQHIFGTEGLKCSDTLCSGFTLLSAQCKLSLTNPCRSAEDRYSYNLLTIDK